MTKGSILEMGFLGVLDSRRRSLAEVQSDLGFNLSLLFILSKMEVKADLRLESGDIVDFSKLMDDALQDSRWFYKRTINPATI